MACHGALWSLVAVAAFTGSSAAQAAMIINVQPSGSNVVATGSGSLKTTGESTNVNGTAASPQINSGTATIGIGASAQWNQWNLTSFSGPANFGSATNQTTFATTASGDIFQMVPGFSVILLPISYVSGAALNDSATWNGATLASLNLVPGQYVYTYGTGVNADSITVNVLAVPEPASLGLVAAPTLGLLLRRNRRARRA